jgi:hypothetical protein
MRIPKKFNVAQENIECACKKDSHHCMIADALQKAIPSARFIMVDMQSIRFSDIDKARRHIFLTPPEAQQALIAFDQGQEVKPFVVSLNPFQGFSRPMRSHVKGYRRSKKKYPKRQKGEDLKRYMPSRFREYGVRKLGKALRTGAREE